MVKTEETLKLQFPVEIAGETYTHITIRRPKGKDLRTFDQYLHTPMTGMLAMIDACIKDEGVPAGFSDHMDEVDIDAAQEVLDSFRPKSKATGNSGSD